MTRSRRNQYIGGSGVVVIAPPWPYAGSSNLFAAQVAAHAAQGRKVFLLVGPIDREHCAARVKFWSRAMQGLSFPNASFVRYASNPDSMLGPNSRSLGQWQSAGRDDAIAISARYAANADLPLEISAFIYKHSIPIVHVNHCFEALLGRRIADLIEQIQGRRPSVMLDTHDVQAMAFHTAGKRNHHADQVDSLGSLQETELALCQSAEILVHCAQDDMAYFRRRAPGKQHELLLPSLDPRTERGLIADRGRGDGSDFDFLYVGNNNAPNCESVAWFLDEVAPRLEPGMRIGIIGGVADLLRSLRPDLYVRYKAIMIGEVDKVEEFYRRSKAIIAPAASGTGTSIKLIEGLCAGKPMVVTSHALRGLPTDERSQPFLKVADTPEDFAAAMGEVLAQGCDSGARAAAFYDRTFSSDRYAKQLNAIVRRTIKPESKLRRIYDGVRAGGFFGPMTTTFRVDLPSPSIPMIFREGWHEAEPFGRWTAAAQSEMLVVLPEAVRAPLRITAELARPAAAPVRLTVNDLDAGHPNSSDRADRPTWRLEHLSPDRILRLRFEYGAVTKPYKLSSADSRLLGLAVQAISIEAEEVAAAPPRTMASVLMCKSFAADLPRFEILVRSVLTHNQSALPLVVCAPHADLAAFRRVVPANTTLLAEEEFVDPRCFDWLDGWRQQQVVKLAFYRLGICDRYLAIDSDCYFIRPFSDTDIFGGPTDMRLVAQTSNPEPRYGALTDDHDLALGRTVRPIYSAAQVRFGPDPLTIPDCFVRDRNYKNCPPELARGLIPFAFSAEYPQHRLTCLPPPMLFCADVLAAFEAMIVARDLSFIDLIHLAPWEAEWYGHFAMKYFAGRIQTVTPMFKHYTTDAQLAAARRAGVTDKSLACNYLGVNLAARHQADLRI